MKARVAAGLLTMAALAGPVRAGDVRFGPQLSFGVGGDADAGVGLGARAMVDLAETRPGLGLVASLDYFPSPEGGAEGDGFKVDTSYMELNASLTHTFNSGGRRGRVRKARAVRLTPYVGAGFNVARASSSVKRDDLDISSSETDVGLNLLGGLKLTRNAFVEVRGEISGGEQLVLTVGYVF